MTEINTSLRRFSLGNSGEPGDYAGHINDPGDHMAYVALEWDHKIGRPIIEWLVVKCSSVGQKFGGPQALPPRRDVAYFVNEESAERDAKAFAAYKTRQEENAGSATEKGTTEAYSKRHAAFAWDHNIFNPLIQWAVLEWNGENPDGQSFRNDVAYFLDPETAQSDAKAFRVIRDEFVVNEPVIGQISARTSKRARNRSAA